MKRYDYFWCRAATQITGIIFFTQLIGELIAARKPGYEWILPACGIAFLASVLWALALVVLNALQRKEQHK